MNKQMLISLHHFLWWRSDHYGSVHHPRHAAENLALLYSFHQRHNSCIFYYLYHFTCHWSQKPASEILFSFNTRFQILSYSLPLL